MARFNIIDSDMWFSETIQSYDSMQLAVFFYYHTCPNLNISGIYQVNLSQDCHRFKTHNSLSAINQPTLLTVINSMPKNLLYDPANSLIFAVKHFLHSGLKRGNPNLNRRSVQRDMQAYPNSPLWNSFIKTYPFFADTLSKVRASFEQTISKFKITSDIPATSPPAAFSAEKQENSHTPPSPSDDHKHLKKNNLMKLLPKYFNTLDKVSSISNSERGGDYKGGGKQNSLDPQLLLQSEKFLQTFDAFLQFREANGSISTEQSVVSTFHELAKLSTCNPENAIAIINHSLKNGYKGLFLPPELKSAHQKNTSRSESSTLEIYQKKCQEALSASGIPGSSLDDAFALFAKEHPNTNGLSKKKFLQQHTGDFCRWLESEKNPNRLACTSKLEKLGISDADTLTRIFHFVPKLTPQIIDTHLDEIKDNGSGSQPADRLLRSLLYGSAPEPKPPPEYTHPLLQKARAKPLSKKEYEMLPFMYRDRLFSTDHGKTFSLK